MKILPTCFLICAVILCWSEDAVESSGVNANVEYQNSRMIVTASVQLPVPPCGAFRLMTDYDSLPKYIPGMMSSHHEYIRNNLVKVWQEGEVELWFFRYRINSLLEIQETPIRKISFKQLDGKLASYSGEFDLLDVPMGTQVQYRAELTLRHYIPVFLAKIIIEDEIRKRFSAIAKEAVARKRVSSLDCKAAK
jgi:hypothetical protein